MASINYLQRIGKSSCIRCDFETDENTSFAEQDAAMMAHLAEKHPNWMTEGLTKEQQSRLAEKQLTPDQKRIAALEAQLAGKWISVKERLPQEIENGYRWVQVYDFDWETMYYASWNGEEWHPTCNREQGTITHWQPLPTAPHAGVSTGDAGTDKSA